MWNPIWHQAMTQSLLNGKAFGSNKTIIFTIHSPIDGTKLRIKFSNRFGKVPYEIGSMRVNIHGQSIPVTLNGETAFDIPIDGCIYSDEIPLAIPIDTNFEIRLYYKNPINDCNMIEEGASLLSGNQVDSSYFDTKKPLLARILGSYNAIPTIETVEVFSEQSTKSIVAFGDSITAMSQWTKPLAKRLETTNKSEFVLLNSGISGNCLLYEPKVFFGPIFGEKGSTRFQKDVLDIPNLHTVIIGLGVNDVAYYKDENKNVINLDTYMREIIRMVNILHEKDVRVVIQTLTPRLGVSRIMGVFTPEMERLRLLLNDWIRSAGIFDYVFDAEAVVQEQLADGIYYREGLHKGDHLHPNAIGGQKLADAYDLNKLTGKSIP